MLLKLKEECIFAFVFLVRANKIPRQDRLIKGTTAQVKIHSITVPRRSITPRTVFPSTNRRDVRSRYTRHPYFPASATVGTLASVR